MGSWVDGYAACIMADDGPNNSLGNMGMSGESERQMREQKIPTEWWIIPLMGSPKLEEESQRMFKAKAKEVEIETFESNPSCITSFQHPQPSPNCPLSPSPSPRHDPSHSLAHQRSRTAPWYTPSSSPSKRPTPSAQTRLRGCMIQSLTACGVGYGFHPETWEQA